MKDQYGDPIPNDLVFIDKIDVDLLKHGEFKRIMKAKWYSVRVKNFDWIVVSAAEIGNLYLTYELENPERFEIMLIDNPLKRWNWEDGFCHA